METGVATEGRGSFFQNAAAAAAPQPQDDQPRLRGGGGGTFLCYGDAVRSLLQLLVCKAKHLTCSRAGLGSA
jgi:hypothetical protein